MGEYLFDLDGTLAKYDKWRGLENIGEPTILIQKALDLIAAGQEVKIFTARADMPEAIPYVQAWCVKHGLVKPDGTSIDVTNRKSLKTVRIFDDIARQVEFNTGIVLGKS